MRGITIGQVANYAGVTIKAVRHYHENGLLAEPPRDSSGYRRYNAQHAIDLVKIKTLAEAGVPLARVKELMAADPEHFASAISAINHKIEQRIEELMQIRQRITQINHGDRLFVSAAVAEFLDTLRAIGVSQRTVQLERDLWILVQSISPKEAAILIGDKREQINDPEFRSLYLAYDAAFDWPRNDARLVALAERSKAWFAKQSSRAKNRERPVLEPTILQLVATFFNERSPAWARLAELAKER